MNLNVDEITLLKGILKLHIVNVWTGLTWLRKRAVVSFCLKGWKFIDRSVDKLSNKFNVRKCRISVQLLN